MIGFAIIASLKCEIVFKNQSVKIKKILKVVVTGFKK